jgi:hypothetical protein
MRRGLKWMPVDALSRVRLSLVMSAAVAVGCGGNGLSLPAGQTWSSPHFVYAARAEDDSVCGGVVDQLETHFALVNAYMGLDWPGGVINYYKYVDEADLDSHSYCPGAADACANDGVVHSPRVLDGHELVHVYTRHLGRPPFMFEEGLAEALSSRGRVFWTPSLGWREVLNAAPIDGVPPRSTYSAGAWFVSYLLRNQGPGPFVALYSALAHDADETAVAAAFQQSYGVPLDDVWGAAQAAGPAEEGLPLWECASEPIALGGPAVELGDRCDGRGSFATFALERESPITWEDVTLAWGFNIASCDSVRHLYVQQVAWDTRETGALVFPAGMYYLASTQDPGSVALSVAPNALATTCEDAAPMVLPSDGSSLILAIANDPEPWFAKLHPGTSAGLRLSRKWDDPLVPNVTVATVELCPDCASPCQPLDGTAEVPIADGQILRISGLSAPAGATVARFSYR